MKIEFEKFWQALDLLGPNAIQPTIHQAFRKFPKLKEAFTEALLTFDTEAGGQTMNLQAAPAGKEEQP